MKDEEEGNENTIKRGPSREDSLEYIATLFPPDSKNEETARVGLEIFNLYVQLDVKPENWRQLPDDALHLLAYANIREADMYGLADRFFD